MKSECRLVLYLRLFALVFHVSRLGGDREQLYLYRQPLVSQVFLYPLELEVVLDVCTPNPLLLPIDALTRRQCDVDRDNVLWFRISVRPPFNSSARLAGTPQEGMTSVWLFNTQSGQHGVLLRFLDFALVSEDHTGEPSVVPCTIETNENDSALIIAFPQWGGCK
jgi:hypothetical protein